MYVIQTNSTFNNVMHLPSEGFPQEELLEELNQQNRVGLDYDREVLRVWWNLRHLHKYRRNVLNIGAQIIVGLIHSSLKKYLLYS